MDNIQRGGEEMILSAKEIAEKIGTDPKTFRRFVRSFVRTAGGVVGEDTPGRGRRYAFDSAEIETIKARFEEWQKDEGAVLVSFGETEDEETE